MLFNSIDFLIFLPIVFFLYWFVFKSRRWQNLFIVVASYVFYGWWDWRFLALIAITSLCSYASGLLLTGGGKKYRCYVCAANIIINLLILGAFKYFNFFAENLAALFKLFDIELDYVTLNVILPVGISFYTFQALSYTIDVYREKIRPTRDLVEFCAFISFFPQLVAGPIERATNLLPQFQQERLFDYVKAVDGCRQMLWGFLKKMVIADNCANVVEQIFGGAVYESSPILWLGAILFTIQIFCDFSGYSDIAIGCAKLFGFELMRNFNNPYFSRSVPEFWRRWHISLTTWFTDYIYIPLGGSKCSRQKTIFNIFVVWSISGLWHGANWTYVCWGMFHATLLSIYVLLGINTKQKTIVAHKRLLPSLKELSQILLTFVFVVIGWVIFRAETLSDAIMYISRMLFVSDMSFDISKPMESLGIPATLFSFLALIVGWLQRERPHGMAIMGNNFITRFSLARFCLYLVMIMVIICFAGSQSEFIYFQF